MTTEWYSSCVEALWIANNVLAAVLFLRLAARRIFPWFRGAMLVMLAQALALSRLERSSLAYAYIWAATEFLFVLLDVASVLELGSLLLKGRLNTTVQSLRWFGAVLGIIALLAASLPLLWQSGEGWQQLVGLLMRTRGYVALGLLLFLWGTSALLTAQPVPVANGLHRQDRCLRAAFAMTALYYLGGSLLSRHQFPDLARFYWAGYTALFAIWIIALWKAPMPASELRIDPIEADRAEGEYKEFRDKVRTFRS